MSAHDMYRLLADRDRLAAELAVARKERDLHIDAFAAQKRERDRFKAERDAAIRERDEAFRQVKTYRDKYEIAADERDEALADGVLSQRVCDIMNERDAAIARAERAGAERDAEVRRLRSQLANLTLANERLRHEHEEMRLAQLEAMNEASAMAPVVEAAGEWRDANPGSPKWAARSWRLREAIDAHRAAKVKEQP